MKPTKTELAKYHNQLHLAAERYGVSTRTIRRWMEDQNVYQPRKGYGPGKLNHGKAAEIRRLYRTDRYTQAELAAIYDVSQGMICRIVNNRAYGVDIIISGSAEVRIST